MLLPLLWCFTHKKSPHIHQGQICTSNNILVETRGYKSVLFLVLLHENGKLLHRLAGDVMLDETGILLCYLLLDT